MLKTLRYMGAALAALTLAGCFASSTPIGAVSDAVRPSDFKALLGGALPLEIVDENARLMRLEGKDFRLYEASSGFVIEWVLSDFTPAYYVYAYGKVTPDGIAIYTDEFASIAAAAGQTHIHAALVKPAIPILKNHVTPEQMPEHLGLPGTYVSWRAHSIEDAAAAFEALISAGLPPQTTIKLRTTQ